MVVRVDATDVETSAKNCRDVQTLMCVRITLSHTHKTQAYCNRMEYLKDCRGCFPCNWLLPAFSHSEKLRDDYCGLLALLFKNQMF